jgi:hypothetical protein
VDILGTLRTHGGLLAVGTAALIAGSTLGIVLSADPNQDVFLEPGEQVTVIAVTPQPGSPGSPGASVTPSEPEPTVSIAPTDPPEEPTPSPTPQAVTSYWLVNPTTDTRVRKLFDGETLVGDFALELEHSSTGSVRFFIDGELERTENNAPYAPCGDPANDFVPCNLSVGSHFIEGIVFSGDNGSGTNLGSFIINVMVGGGTGASPTPSPSTGPPPAGVNVSGITIPAPFPGYDRVHFTEFPNTQQLGDPPHPDTLQYLQPRPNVAQDCTYNDSSGRGKYCWRATTSEHDGLLDMWLHTETGSCKTSGHTHVHNGNGGCNYVAGPKWTLPNQSDFVISYVAKLDDIPGRKVAYLRWCGPKINTAGYCEDNFVEAKLEPGPRGNFFHHLESSNQQQQKSLNIELDEWHLYQLWVKPGQFVEARLDGNLVARFTQGVTTNDSYWVFQSETYLGGQSIPIPHNQGHLLFDKYSVDLFN